MYCKDIVCWWSDCFEKIKKFMWSGVVLDGFWISKKFVFMILKRGFILCKLFGWLVVKIMLLSFLMIVFLIFG